MPPIPWFLRFKIPFSIKSQWDDIKQQVNDHARKRGYIPYSERPTLWSFSGVGAAFLPPCLCFNVRYFGAGEDGTDMGKFVAFHPKEVGQEAP